MRTMSIPKLFIFVCSLIQFSIAEPPKFEVVNCKKNSGIYDCYTPTSCIRNTKLEESYVEQKLNEEIFVNCIALIRFHSYTKEKTYVSIESFDDKVKSIEFIGSLKNNPAKEVLFTFSCIRNAKNENEGKYTNQQGEQYITMKDPPNDTPKNPAKIQCAFQITNKEIHSLSELLVMFKIDNDSTKRETFQKPNERCNPDNFKQDKVITDPYNIYEDIVYSPGEYKCSQPALHKLQFRNETVEYKAIDKIKCEPEEYKYEFVITNKTDPVRHSSGQFRCAAEVKYFCDFEVKGVENESKLNLTHPIAGKAPTKMECPQGKPYLMISGKYKPNATFECLNYNGELKWTVNNIRLTSSGPEAYCTDKLLCNHVFKIPDYAVEDGYLDKDGLPTCFMDGTLLVNGVNVTDTRCDLTIGRFKYTVKDEEKFVDEKTRFVCKYVIKTDTQQDDRNNMLIMAMGGVGIGLTVIIVTVVLFFVIRRMRNELEKKKIKREKEALEKQKRDELEFKQFCYTDVEKKAMKLKRQEEKEEKAKNGEVIAEEDAISAPSTDQSLWSALIMHFTCVAEAVQSLLQDVATIWEDSRFNKNDSVKKERAKVVEADGKKMQKFDERAMSKLRQGRSIYNTLFYNDS